MAAMVARMLRDKGVVDLVEAARLIHQAGHDLTVRLVGPIDLENPSGIPEVTLREWEREGIVEWTGPEDNVVEVWRNAHIAMLPSHREGLPKSLLEAAACGRALIATDVPGCREIVVHEETGLLVPAKDPSALADAILTLAKDAGLRARLGRAARKRVEAQFSIDRVVEKTLALYRSLQTAA